MIELAKVGDKDAAKLVLDRTLGKVRDVEPPPEPGDNQPPEVRIHDYRLKPAKAAELLAATEAGDNSGIVELLRRHAAADTSASCEEQR